MTRRGRRQEKQPISIKSRWWFIARLAGLWTFVMRKTTARWWAFSSELLYRTDNLSWRKFKIISQGKFELLKKRPVLPVRRSVLVLRWSEILLEYSAKTGGAEYSRQTAMINKIDKLRLKMARANSLLVLLSAGNEPEDWKRQFESMFGTSDIKTVGIRLKNTKIELESTIALYERSRSKDNGTVDGDYFINLEIALSKWLGYKINDKQTTVAEMALLQTQYNNYIKSLKNGGGQ